MTTKQKILIGIPLLIITGFLIYCWTVILTTDIIATWKHYLALILFFVLVVLFYKKDKMIVVAIGIYLFLGIMNLLVITPSINLFFIEIKPLSIFFQPLSLGLFVLYFLLNNDTLLNMYLDYRENKSK